MNTNTTPVNTDHYGTAILVGWNSRGEEIYESRFPKRTVRFCAVSPSPSRAIVTKEV